MIDSHIHLDAKIYSDDDGVEAVIQAARQNGVDRFVTPALHFDSFERLLEIQRTHPCVYPAVGVHPHEVTAERLIDLRPRLEAGLEKLVVPILGESGLEGHYDFTLFEHQIESLRAHIEVARFHKVPMILHCRSCEQQLYDELRSKPLDRPGVVHCFTGTWEWAQKFLELGFYIGITGIVTFKNAKDVADVATRIPLDRLLVETDGPYLAPIPHRGRTNKPEYIPLIVETIARLRQTSQSLVAEATVRNTEEMFGLPEQFADASVLALST